MLFHSKAFAIFFPCVVLAFFLTPQRRRWVVLLAASYGFYMAWNAGYAVLLLLSTVIDYAVAFRVHAAETPRKRLAWAGVSLATNLGMLAYFKYTNFFLRASADLAGLFGLDVVPAQYDIILPVGISFYTFQTIGYTLDVYWRRRAPERHFGLFALYVSFFPQLVAGPIERSTQLLPQFSQRQRFDFDRAVSGLALMLLGFFKKLMIADRAARFVDVVYQDPSAQSGLSILLVSYLFAFQIYCDFSAYSDIAIGAARVLGFDLMENFRRPYFARSIPDMWRRWHVSLTTWLKDNLYMALAPKKKSAWATRRNMAIVFVSVGIWHGAEWTFVAFGFYHAALSVLSHIVMPYIAKVKENLQITGFKDTLWGLAAIALTFHLWCLSAIFFRGRSITEAFTMLQRLFTWGGPADAWSRVLVKVPEVELWIVVASIAALMMLELIQGDRDSREATQLFPRLLRPALAAGSLVTILMFGEIGGAPFYYFQF